MPDDPTPQRAYPAAACCAASDDPAHLRRTFDEHGFVAFPGYLSPDEVSALSASVEAFVERLAVRVAAGEIPEEHAMYDDRQRATTLKQVQQFHTHDGDVSELAARLRGLADTLLGEKCAVQNVQYFNKPPLSAYADGGSSRPTPPHQDGYYWMHDAGATIAAFAAPGPCGRVGIPSHAAALAQARDRAARRTPLPSRRLAIDAADEENGCIRYSPGSANGALRPHAFSGVKGFSQQLVGYDPAVEREYAMVATPGDLLVHGAKMIHRAEANRSAARQRRAVGAIFYGASARWDQE
eukprot:4304958-Prymnesium_polylepis.1